MVYPRWDMRTCYVVVCGAISCCVRFQRILRVCTIAIVTAVMAIYGVNNPEVEPIRHEVTLEPGAIIDASKYVIVEQRGEIYVIEEREEGE